MPCVGAAQAHDGGFSSGGVWGGVWGGARGGMVCGEACSVACWAAYEGVPRVLTCPTGFPPSLDHRHARLCDQHVPASMGSNTAADPMYRHIPWIPTQ